MSHTKRVLEKIQACEPLNQNEKVFSSLGNSYFTIVECANCEATGKIKWLKKGYDMCDTCKGFKYLYIPSDDAYSTLLHLDRLKEERRTINGK